MLPEMLPFVSELQEDDVCGFISDRVYDCDYWARLILILSYRMRRWSVKHIDGSSRWRAYWGRVWIPCYSRFPFRHEVGVGWGWI
jgi:hypothetical protein